MGSAATKPRAPSHARAKAQAAARQQRAVEALDAWGVCDEHKAATSCKAAAKCGWVIVGKTGVCTPLHLTRIESVATGIQALCSKPRQSKRERLILHRAQALLGGNASKSAQSGNLCREVSGAVDKLLTRLRKMVRQEDPTTKDDGNLLLKLATLLGCTRHGTQTELLQKVMAVSMMVSSGRIQPSMRRIASALASVCGRVTTSTSGRRVLAAIAIVVLILSAAMLPAAPGSGSAGATAWSLRGSQPHGFSLQADPLHNPSIEVALWDAEATALDTTLPPAVGVPAEFLAVMDNKEPGAPRVGKFATAAGEVVPIHTDTQLANAKDLEAIANEPGNAQGYFLMQSDGKLFHANYDAASNTLVTDGAVQLPALAAHPNYEAMEAVATGRRGDVSISYTMRGGSNKFGHDKAVSNNVTLHKDATTGTFSVRAEAPAKGMVADDPAEAFVRPMADSHGVTDPSGASGITASALDGEDVLDADEIL